MEGGGTMAGNNSWLGKLGCNDECMSYVCALDMIPRWPMAAVTSLAFEEVGTFTQLCPIFILGRQFGWAERTCASGE